MSFPPIVIKKIRQKLKLLKIIVYIFLVDDWLSVLHITPSCSALRVKELMLHFCVPVPEEKNNIPQRSVCWAVSISAQREKIKIVQIS